MLRELKTFLAVVRYGTFVNAGAHIGLTQGAVSAQIKRLEDDLGFPLFDRRGRAAILNEAGLGAAEIVGDILRQYAQLSANGGKARATGILRIGAIASAQVSFLVPAIRSFRERSPGWQLRVLPGVSINLLSQVDAGDLDAAVIIRPPFDMPTELIWHTLSSEKFVLLAQKRMHGRKWCDLLTSEPFIRYDRSSFDGRLVENFLRKTQLPVNDVVELDELQGIVELVDHGVGIALVPKANSLRLPPGVVDFPIDDDTFVREIGLVEQRGRSQSTAIAEFVDCVREKKTTQTQCGDDVVF